MVKIFDNFLDEKSHQNLYNEFLGPGFDWHLGLNGVAGQEDKDSLDHYLFCNVLYTNMIAVHESFYKLAPILNNKKLNMLSLIRVKANLYPRTSDIVKHGIHIDLPFGCSTCIYYINSNNGYTEFEDGTRVESKANRLITFDSKYKHFGTTCTNERVRCMINFNYFSIDRKDWHSNFEPRSVGLIPDG